MVDLKGKGARTGVNLVARVFDNAKTKDGKSQYADLQVDSRDPRGAGQRSLHLHAERVAKEGGGFWFNDKLPYSMSQISRIIETAGENKTPILHDGVQVGTVYGFKGNVMPASRGPGLVVNTRSLQASDFQVDAHTLDNQFDSVRAAAESEMTQRVSALYGPDGPFGGTYRSQHAAETDEPALG